MACKIVGRSYATWDFRFNSQYEFKWKIHDFSRTSCEANIGDCFASPKFITKYISEDIEWRLHLYPRGGNDASKNHVSLYVFSSTRIKATISLAIFNNKGQLVQNFKMPEHQFEANSTFGYARYLPRDLFLNPENGILNNNKLTIVCKIQLTANEINIDELCSESDNDEVEKALSVNLEAEYEALFNDSKYADFCLVSEGKSVLVHKCIIGRKSTVFAAMFDKGTKENENTVKLTNINYGILVEMLRFIYTGRANNIDAVAGELAVAADMYAVDSLKLSCERSMRRNLSSDNVIECLKTADRLRMHKLKKHAIDFIVEKARDVTKKPEFSLLPVNIVLQVCQSLAESVK